jgi:hypothetical protein
MAEEEVLAVLRNAGEGDPKWWIFDTGASNHMTGIREIFTDLDTSIVGTVQFGDGSVLQIEGCNTILFVCKSGEHRTLAKTYYIPCLTANIVSYGQLDEDGLQIHIKRGVMRIHDEKMRLLAKIYHSFGPVCLATCGGGGMPRACTWGPLRFGHINFDSLQKTG